MRVTAFLFVGCISTHPDSADTAPGESQEAPCVEWCPDVDGDGLGAPDLACAPVCLPSGDCPDTSVCAYVPNCEDPEPMLTAHGEPGVPPPVLALVRWLNDARPNHDNDPYWMRADCDDTDPTVYPGAPEIPYDGKDNDCDPTTADDDLDGDGFHLLVDCNDADPNRWADCCANRDQ